MLHTFFWLGAGLVVYTYLGYPALIDCLARLCTRSFTRDQCLRTVSVIVVAHNEESLIRRRLRNLLRSDYPRGMVEIIVACDGATDRTAARAGEYRGDGVHVIEYLNRRGKGAVLNDTVPRARGEIIILADVRQRFSRGAIRLLVADFADKNVGAVGGRLVIQRPRDGSQTGVGTDFYWRYETFIRNREARVDSMVGATGAIYAIRRTCFRKIPPATILDDVLIPMQIVRLGYRVVYESAAIAYDVVPALARAESVRKVRTIGGNFQLFLIAPWLLVPIVNRLWLQTVSHKFLRLLSPMLLLGVFILNVALLAKPLYHAIFVGQVLFYMAGIVGWVRRNSPRKSVFLNVPYTFCLLNWVTVIAFLRFLRGHQSPVWERSMGPRIGTRRLS